MFDFENDDWPDGMRVTYKMIRWCFLDERINGVRHDYLPIQYLNIN